MNGEKHLEQTLRARSIASWPKWSKMATSMNRSNIENSLKFIALNSNLKTGKGMHGKGEERLEGGWIEIQCRNHPGRGAFDC